MKLEYKVEIAFIISIHNLYWWFTVFYNEVNPKNMSKFAHQFQKRTDIVPHLKEGLKCDALLVVGTKSSHLHAAEYMHSQMDKVWLELFQDTMIW